VRAYAALLRGINLAGRNRISMPELAKTLISLGLEDVSTYLQSGNIAFLSASVNEAELRAAIEGRVAEVFGLPIAVVLRTDRALAEIAKRNPFIFDEPDPKLLHVAFLDGAPEKQAIAGLDPDRSPPDRFAVRGREIYLHFPKGSGRSKLGIDYFERKLGVVATARNWNTVLKLAELTASLRATA
jgi:uncharacterized protein (DUF1697 family)